MHVHEGRPHDWALLAVLIVATLAAYAPAWHGAPLWDDDAHLTRPALRSLSGLWQIWFDVGATQQYYPITHSAFWLMQRLWGSDTLGYHLVNILLHATSAYLLSRLLLRLEVPGVRLGAVVFALHPVQVESVAWMTELKNTLSGALCLGAALVYLQYDRRRDRRTYGLALCLYALSLFAKSVTAVLPGALLVVCWWRQGRVSWRRDVRPLLPFFAIGIAAGATTAWFERMVNGARGAEFQLAAVERLLIAGRAIWFYLSTIVWPVSLSFIYPRWTIDARTVWQYLYPAAVLAALAVCWLTRRRHRGPLAAALLFCGTLFPALGFFDVYPFRFSFVADHFQYLATIPIVAGASAVLVARLGRRHRRIEAVLMLAFGIPLAVLTFRQSRLYADSDTLFLATLARNPDCWMCHVNLATSRLYGSRAGLDEAMAHLREALRLNPLDADAHNNMGGALQRLGRYDEAIAEHGEAARLNPLLVQARYNLGVCRQALGQLDAARADYEAAIRLQPGFAPPHHNLGTVLQQMGLLDRATSEIETAIRLEPTSDAAYVSLGGVQLQGGHVEAAIAQYREALRLNPGSIDARLGLGSALATTGRLDEAETEFRAALAAAPDSAAAHSHLAYLLLQRGRADEGLAELRTSATLLGNPAQANQELAAALQKLGRTEEAAAAYRRGVQHDPANADAHYQLALSLAGSHRLAEAIPEFEQAVRLAPRSAEMHHDFGAALANAGRYREAVAEFQEAVRLKPDFAEAKANLERFSRAVPRK